jgi:hypothetical protein
VEWKASLVETWLMEVERRILCFVLLESGDGWSPGFLEDILAGAPYLHAGYRCGAVCTSGHLSYLFFKLEAP